MSRWTSVEEEEGFWMSRLRRDGEQETSTRESRINSVPEETSNRKRSHDNESSGQKRSEIETDGDIEKGVERERESETCIEGVFVEENFTERKIKESRRMSESRRRETASTERRVSDDMKSSSSSGICKREECTQKVVRMSERSSREKLSFSLETCFMMMTQGRTVSRAEVNPFFFRSRS